MKLVKLINKYFWLLIMALTIMVAITSARLSQAALTRLGNNIYYVRYSGAAVSAKTTASSDSFPTDTFVTGSFQVVWADHTSGGSATTSTFELQSSTNGGSNWDTIASTSTTTSGVSGSETIDLSTLPGSLIRVTVTGTSAGTAPTLTPYFVGKR